ncbi:ubiquitin carboxyl-terminal hydrolase 16-like [Daphnia carinata]|uniref:ubiquitin carboxyl-terminal hydrolase 16-like n=1 Tax=Daphnia carinata TaxID=120202 RepID=UPI002580CF21|nr:ubiquitin carboxyl-terminal hydrolase 16-like [Daphnia carinata]XP_059350629.1 ubiquitin carboxyl-terminal hydrolase 16-like [Daphnia carinata]
MTMADSGGLTQAVEFSRKPSGLTGKSPKRSSMKRSQSHYDAKELSKIGYLSPASIEAKTKDTNGKESVNESLPSVKGLSNLGNTCFFNSVMQVLSQTHWLTQLLDMEVRDGHVIQLKGSDGNYSCKIPCITAEELDGSSPSIDPSESEDAEDSIIAEPINVSLGPGKPLTLTLASFLKDMHCPAVTGGTGKRRQSLSTVTPSSLFNQVCKKSPQFRGFQQQDAHELLRHLLDGIRTEEITRRRHAIMSHFDLPVTVAKNQQAEVDPVLKRKLKVYGKESAHTFVDQLFGGQLLSTVICESCHHQYQILEPFMDLSLPVSEDKSPPANHKRKTNVVDSLSCLGSSTPATISKHQRKKERKAERRGKGRRFKNKEEEEMFPASTQDDVASLAVEEESSAKDDADSTKTDDTLSVKTDDTLSLKTQDKETSKTETYDEDESLASSGREDEDEDIGGDVEDNNEEVIELVSRIDQVRIDSASDEDETDRVKIDSPPTTPTAKKIRSEWIAKSLCSLAVRYHATNQECSVQSCLNLFTAPELLTGSNKYGCENCTKRKAAAAIAEGADENTKIPTVYSVASKQLLIFAPPALLTLHLKRFTQNGIALRKAQKHVDFPLRLDLAPFCSAAAAGVSSIPAHQKEVIYSLYGVIEHSGRLSSGHYTAFVKVRPVTSELVTQFLQREPMQTEDLHRLRDQLSERLLAERTTSENNSEFPSDGVWYYCSDSHVTAVSEEKVLRSQAFLLFYERVL